MRILQSRSITFIAPAETPAWLREGIKDRLSRAVVNAWRDRARGWTGRPMKIQIAVLAAAALFHLIARPAEAAPTWAQTFGVDPGMPVGNDFAGDYPRSIVRMPDGGAVVGGYIFVPGSAVQSNVTYKGIFGESALVRYAADGSIIWKKVLGPFALNASFVTSMVADPAGNISVASGRPFDAFSGAQGTPYVAKFSADGTLQWATNVKLPGKPDPNQGNATPYLNNFATSIILTSDGKVAVGGSYNPGAAGGIRRLTWWSYRPLGRSWEPNTSKTLTPNTATRRRWRRDQTAQFFLLLYITLSS